MIFVFSYYNEYRKCKAYVICDLMCAQNAEARSKSANQENDYPAKNDKEERLFHEKRKE